MKLVNRVVLLLTIIAMSVFLYGCGKSEQAADDKAKPTEEVGKTEGDEKEKAKEEEPKEEVKEKTEEKKDELVISVGTSFDSGKFDPKQRYGSHQQHRLTHSSLLKYDVDLNLIGDLAEDYSITEDGLEWSFTLNPNVKFSDGNPVKAEDVVFTYEMLKEDGIAFDLSFMESIEKTDENKVVIKLTEPRSVFVSQVTEIPIVPANHYDENYTKNPIGSGAYKVVEYREGEQVIMEANPHYHKPLNFKKLTFLLLKEDAAVAAAKTGELDICVTPPRYADQKIDGMVVQACESIDSRGITLPTLPSGNKGLIHGVEVEVGNDVTSEVAIRRALNVGLSRNDLCELALSGYGKPAFSVCDGLPWFNEDIAIKDGDIEAAKKILEEDGWSDTDGDGIVEKDGKKASFKLYYNAQDQLRSDLSIGVADQAKAFGVDIEAVGSSWDEIFKIGKANAVLWGGGRHHPGPLHNNYSSDLIDVGYNNMPQFSDPNVDANLEKAMKSANILESYEYWKKVQWDKDTNSGVAGNMSAPMIWLTRIDHVYFVREGLDLGRQQVHAHGHEWGLFNDMDTWGWK
ncbi:ABC transporter substrate-binding protein [Microaceticoccus formicicus]|uniref:ABC transporter substrate-binding protein n=1 Tax=Microaceticoccus formicicus TaxID=3118105 RepID=UPI003CD04959|nr:ABC transporter substrate-binding protein [Peptoniphilaceae bacterium AMB_02]